jgi:MoaA/NifB/PqqE/SkfB family radical SAM enzyme
LEHLLPALDFFRNEGFNAVGISGGEPLLYAELGDLLLRARELGMTATVTTNAMLISEERADMLKKRATLVAVSLDGPPDSHNRMRGHPRAFDRMAAGVDQLTQVGVPFGFIFTLTMYNLHELEWVTTYAVSRGACLLQVHPLEEVGRAVDKLQGEAPDDFELGRAFVEVARLQQQYQGRITIQYDVADVEDLRSDPARGFAIDLPCSSTRCEFARAKLADMVAPVIVAADGSVVPLQYGFARAYGIGNIHEDLGSHCEAWKRDTFPSFIGVCRRVHERLATPGRSSFPFVNWYSEVLQESFKPAGLGPDRVEHVPAGTGAPRRP